jgi:cytochrome P450
MITSQLFGLLIAGHDTTSTTLLWATKFLAADQDLQRKLRADLHKRFSTAHSQNRVPSGQEIANTQSHLLDAFIEETLRCANTGALVSRCALTDAVVLGHVIPKGTRVILPGHPLGTFSEAYKISDDLRSEKYHNADTDRIGNWDVDDIAKFKAERWLVHDKESGGLVFDPSAGPHIAFGGGLRGCFGKRMAYLELRIALVLVLWNFELQPTEEKYSGWEAMEILTHSPVDCYVKLAKASTFGQM